MHFSEHIRVIKQCLTVYVLSTQLSYYTVLKKLNVYFMLHFEVVFLCISGQYMHLLHTTKCRISYTYNSADIADTP